MPSLTVMPDSHPCWQFPSGLLGSQQSTRAFAKSMVRKAIKHGNWRHAWQECETQSILNSPADIWVSAGTSCLDGSRYRDDESLWRLNELTVELWNQGQTPGLKATVAYLCDQCLDELWFCLGMLQGGMTYQTMLHQPAAAERWRIGTQLVRWLPEMLHLSGRIANRWSLEDVAHRWTLPSLRCQWAHGLEVCFRELGIPVLIPRVHDAEWDLLDELIRIGAVKIVAGRTELVRHRPASHRPTTKPDEPA